MPCSFCHAPKVLARGLCQNCYHRLRNRKTLERAYQPRIGACSVPDCGKAVEAKGLCSWHYQKAQPALKNTWKLLRNRWKGEYPPSWSAFAAFAADVGERPSEKSQLRRKDTRLPWSKDNVYWVDPVPGGKDQSMTPERRAAYAREWNLRRQYKITGDQYEALLKKQKGVCAICERPSKKGKLAIDHCHASGVVRGLLCVSCNRGIGYLGDNADRLRNALKYLTA